MTPASASRTSACWYDAVAALRRNQPMKAVQTPPRRSPPKILVKPQKISRKATPRPISEVTNVARL